MNRLTSCAAFVCCLLLAVSTSNAQARRGMMPADTLRVAGVGDAQISPDGEWVVYTINTIEGNASHTALWLARVPNAAPNRTTTEAVRTSQLLPDGFNAQTPRWSPDSRRIAFQGSQQGQQQSGLWTISLDNRQPRLLTPLSSTNFFITYAGESFAWSPDSRRIAFINASEDETETMSAASSKQASDPRVIDRIQYKSRTSFSDRARTHVWVVDVEAAERERPATTQLTSGQFYDHAVTWNPSGNEIAFLSNHEQDPDANNNSDIFAVDLGGRVRQLTETSGCEYEPAWSPDGKWIAYTATRRDVTTIDSVAEDAHIWIVEARGGTGRELTGAQDRRARSPHWSPDSRSIFYLAGDRGQTLVYRVGTEGGAIRGLFDNLAYGNIRGNSGPITFVGPMYPAGPIIPARPFQISSFSLSAGSVPSLACTLGDALHPAEVWISSLAVNALLGRETMRRISAHNDALMRSLILVEPEEINFKSFDGTSVQGWLMKPLNFRETQRFPLILSVHGGPHGMFGYAFNPAFQVYAARGYAVLYLNPRGSSGYGQRFSDGTLREWGGGDYQDLMRGVDEALRTRSWIDAERLGVTGGSYGGFMTNWIVTQTPRFKAAVASASVSNLISFYSTSLYQDLVHAEFGGFPWEDYDLLWRWSPLHYIKQAQTPLLLLHGEQDNDVHITQAEEMYMALKRRGVETVLVRYPREGHGFREPQHRIDALERTIGWFDKFLK
ncbi:MAG TPA: S9 family peptidase [Pyrinomonadaceae bacterium]|nr:S9 family peptidase [Pyrinomonadaceae bacterium]